MCWWRYWDRRKEAELSASDLPLARAIMSVIWTDGLVENVVRVGSYR